MAELSGEDRMMLGAYTELARKIWDDEAYGKQALDDSRKALAENGWTVPEGIEVSVEIVNPDDAPPADADVSRIVKVWAGEIEAGELRIVVPSSPPPPEVLTLSDEELASVSGGEHAGCKLCGTPSKYPPADYCS